MIVAVTGLSALVPSVLLAWYFYSRDARREPARAVWATFGLGVLSIVPTLLVDWPIMEFVLPRFSHPLAAGPAEAFLVAAIPEELFKFSVLYGYARRRRWFDEPMDGVVYGAIASLGFATLENVLYCLRGGMPIAVMRAVTSVPGHAFWGAIMGYFVGVAQWSPPAARGRLLLHALGWPVLLHGLYDAGLLTIKSYGERGIDPAGAEEIAVVILLLVSLAAVVLSWVYGIRITRRMRRAQRLALQLASGAPVPPARGRSAEADRMLAAIWPVDAGAGDEPLPAAPSGPVPVSRLRAWLALLAGGILALGGAFMLLGSIGVTIAGNVVGGIVVGLLFGCLPLALAVFLFRGGLRRLPRRVRISLPPIPRAVPTERA
jgi:RsiW-degrading membrane proteinase PrsW (M82 family)